MKRIKMNQLQDGDIFWWSPEEGANPHLLGHELEVMLTGADQIFIVDDVGDMGEGILYINGGHEVYVTGDEDVVLLWHYGKLLKKLKKLDALNLKKNDSN